MAGFNTPLKIAPGSARHAACKRMDDSNMNELQ